MKLSSLSFSEAQAIPPRYAFGKIDPNPNTHITLSDNVNPQLAWDDVPPGTRSFVLLCHDPDVPSLPDDVNQADREVPASLPRVDFYHWVLIELPAEQREIKEGEYSHEITPRGKAGPLTSQGARQGVNDYTQWFASDHDMRGEYFGYDGPCPPWNDALMHRYVFTVYALDIENLPLDGTFTGADVKRVIEGHVLAQASLTGLYTLNPSLMT